MEFHWKLENLAGGLDDLQASSTLQEVENSKVLPKSELVSFAIDGTRDKNRKLADGLKNA